MGWKEQKKKNKIIGAILAWIFFLIGMVVLAFWVFVGYAVLHYALKFW